MIRSRRVRSLVALLAVFLPRPLRRFAHTRLLGYRLHPTARIGHSLIDVDSLEMGQGAVIGHLVIIRGCEEVRLGDWSIVQMLVWVNSVRAEKGYFREVERRPALILGHKALITVMHFIDACDLVELEDFASLAGFGSLVQTHAVDLKNLKQDCAPVRISESSLVASRSTLLPGAIVPSCSIVAAGSVVNGKMVGHHLFGGVPAKPLRETDLTWGYFNRPREGRPGAW
jgi:acetyltransferase-like isoleucine patch superfamily enzyme